MKRELSRWLGALALLLGASCAAGPSHTTVGVPPPPSAGTSEASPAVVLDVPLPVATASAPAVSPAPSASAAAPVPSGAPPSSWKELCVGALFDLEKLPEECAIKYAPPRGLSKAFTVALKPDEKTVRSGESVGVTLTFTNVSATDQEIVLDHACEFFDVQAFAHGKRADYVTDCGHGRGCGGAPYRLVLVPKGTITRKLTFIAKLSREMSRVNCAPVVTPLAKGRYELRVEATDFFLAPEVRKLRAPIEVVP